MNISRKFAGGMAVSILMTSSPAWAQCVHEANSGAAGAGSGDGFLPLLAGLVTVPVLIGFGMLIVRGVVYLGASMYELATQSGKKHPDNQEIETLGIKTNKAIEALELEYEAKLLEALEKTNKEKPESEKSDSEKYTLTSV